MTIIAGNFKGKKIPFPQKFFPKAQVTPSKVKEAVFSILGKTIEGKNFIDLFACSGQIGLEAISRGANFVLFNDIDKQYAQHITKVLRTWNIAQKAMVLCMPMKQCLSFCEKKGLFFEIAYIDPPYVKNRGTNPFLEQILEDVSKANIFSKNAHLFVQHYYANELPEQMQKFIRIKTRKYGTNSITEYIKKS